MVKALFTKYKYLFLVLAISLLAVFNLGNYGIPPTHDGEYNVMRSWQHYKVLSEGNLYPRWAPDFNNGFGIPIFSYIYPLPSYVSSILHVAGFNFIDSFKLEMAIFTLMGAVFFYLWARKYWGEIGGAVSAIFYTFSPYHFVDIYVRGSAGEVASLGIFPGLLWAYLTFVETKKYRYFIFSSLLLGLLIYAHNILALIFFVFFTIYSLFLIPISKRKKENFVNFILIIIIGLGLSAPFWLPALFETPYVHGLQIFDVGQNFPELYQLLIPSWGYGLSPTDLVNPMSVQIGIANLVAFFGSFIVLFFAKQKRIILFFIASFIVIFFLMTSNSAWVWHNIPLFSYFQFPWRLLSLEILICSFLAGSIVSDDIYKKKDKLKIVLSAILIFISVGLSFSYARAAKYYPRSDSHYLSRSNFTDGTNSLGNAFNTKWLNSIPKKAKNKIEITRGSGNLKIIELKSLSYIFNIESRRQSNLLINTAYFPGWSAQIDGKASTLHIQNGKMLLSVPSGNHNVKVYLGNTRIQEISYVYFLFSVLLLTLLSGKTIAIIKE